MGRPSTPTAEKIAKGNPGHRPLNNREPDPDYLDDMTPPERLSDEAKKVWAHYAPLMRKAKVLTVIDVEPFSRWCELVVRYWAVRARIERDGVMIERGEKEAGGQAGKKGKVTAASHVVNQLVYVESMLQKQLLAVEREFGMTPAARTHVRVEPQLDLFGKTNDGAGESAQPQQQPKGPSYFTRPGQAH